MRRPLARLAAVAALGMAVVATLLVVRTSDPTYELTAVFDSVKGLVEGGEVRAGGVKVGTVEEIWLDDDDLPRVRLRISDDYRVRQGATADVRLFSNSDQLRRFVMLHRGRGPELPNGATLGLARTDQPVEIDELLRTLDPETRADIRSVFSRLNSSTVGRGPNLALALERSAAALGETATLMGQVSHDRTALRALVREGRVMVSAVAREPQSLGEFADRLGALLAVMRGRQTELAAAIERLPDGLRSPRRALDRLHASLRNLRELVRAGTPAVRELKPTLAELHPTLVAAGPALESARRLVRSAPADLRPLGPLLADTVPTLRVLDPVLCQSNPILDELRTYAPEVVAMVTNLADAVSNYDANGHLIRLAIVGSRPPQNQLGPADGGAGYLRRPFARAPGSLTPIGQPWTDFERSHLTRREDCR